MEEFIKRVVQLMLCSVLVCLSVASAIAAGYQDRPEVVSFIDDLVVKEGFNRQLLLDVFAQAEYKPRIIEAISRPSERVLHWDEYQDIFLTEKRRSQGVAFIKTHRRTLKKAQQKFGVPPEIVSAILGVETYYGRITGSYRVLDALSTLAFDYPPRSRFFKSELRQLFLLAREQKQEIVSLTGSYAGAMGLGQFIPSSYRRYAIDFDQDGVADIWNNPVDAIGSVANYLKSHGWQANQEVVLRIDDPGSLSDGNFNRSLKPSMTIAEARLAGVSIDLDLKDAAKVSPMKLQGKVADEYFLGLKNFYVITRYNHSKLYAMAVFQLSQQLAQSSGINGLAD
jgi:membrane-bound lytic murein transglycosylase B